jgi:LPS-assembly lipoprotein
MARLYPSRDRFDADVPEKKNSHQNSRESKQSKRVGWVLTQHRVGSRPNLRLSFTIVLFACLTLTACGFTLRGMMERPTWLTSIALNIQEVHQDLALALKENFKTLCIPIVPPKRAQFLLIVEKDESQQQITSVSASTTPRQYQLRYTVIYSLLKANGEPIISSNKAVVTRQLTVNNDRILGSNFEEMLTYKEMRKEAAMQIANRQPFGKLTAY